MKKGLAAVSIVFLLILVGGGVLYLKNKDKAENDPHVNTNHTSTTETDNNITSTAQNNIVGIENFNYAPENLTIKKGSTVTWTNNDTVAHTVTSDSGNVMDSPLFGKGETYSVTFNEVGTFSYFCKPHPNMKGTITVTE